MDDKRTPFSHPLPERAVPQAESNKFYPANSEPARKKREYLVRQAISTLKAMLARRLGTKVEDWHEQEESDRFNLHTGIPDSKFGIAIDITIFNPEKSNTD